MHRRLGEIGAALNIFGGTAEETAEETMQPSNHILPGTLAGLKRAGLNDSFYWMPSATNFPGVDGVLGDTDGHVYAIQATISEDHKDPNEGIKKVWGHLLPEVRTGRAWRYVVVAETRRDAEKYVDEFKEKLSDFTLGQDRTRVQVWGCVLHP